MTYIDNLIKKAVVDRPGSNKAAVSKQESPKQSYYRTDTPNADVDGEVE